MTLFKSLTHRPFAFLWSGQTVSRLGDSIFYIALAWWVLEETGSAAAMGTMFILTNLPMMIFMLLGGVAGDRFSRSRVMLTSDLLRGLVVSIVAALAFSDSLDLWHVYVASIIFGLLNAFFQPAYVAIVPEITPREVLPSANSLTTLSDEISGIVGPALGAALVALGGTSTAFALDGLSFFISAAFLLPLLRLTALQKPVGETRSMLRDLREGIGLVLASPWLWISISYFAISNIPLSGRHVAFPFLVSENLGGDVGALGTVYSMGALGALLGAVWLGRFPRLRRRGLTMYLSAVVGGLMLLGMGIIPWLPGVALAQLIFGIFMTVSGLIWINTLQELVPRNLLGRVSSIDYLGSFVFLPIGFGVAGWVTDLAGAPLVFIIGGALYAVLAILALAHPAIRNLD